jgi:putative Holliday junction resolvase
MALEPNQSIIALDYGSRRVGVAIASSAARLASPLTTLDNSSNLIADIEKIIETENIGTVVVGYPRDMSGRATAQTKIVEEFIEKLQDLKLEVRVQDESLTSVHAEAELGHKKGGYSKAEVDALAATYILEDYLSENER